MKTSTPDRTGTQHRKLTHSEETGVLAGAQ